MSLTKSFLSVGCNAFRLFEEPLGKTIAKRHSQRPDLDIPALRIQRLASGSPAPGYWLISTWGGAGQLAPYIFDNGGELVWSGFSAESPETGYYNLRAYHFPNGTEAMSVIAGNSLGGQGRGTLRVLDNSYRTVDTIGADRPGEALDFHIAQLSKDGHSAFVDQFEAQQSSSEPAHGEPKKWLASSVIQQRELGSGRLLSQWRASDFVNSSESTVPDGAGQDPHQYDFFHLNSFDRFSNGDMLLSARNTDTVYRISSETGEIIWRLGGRYSSFIETGFELRGQHDVRILPGERSLSIYNNNWHHDEHGSPSAMVIEIDEVARTANLLREWHHLDDSRVARHSGSVQVMPSEHVLVGWGASSGFTEFGPDGSRLLEAEFEDANTLIYRIEKNYWIGRPMSRPDLYVTGTSSPEVNRTDFYMSWNGATQVVAWNVYSSSRKHLNRREIQLLGKVERSGFETHFAVSKAVPAGFVEPLDVNGSPLSRSLTVDAELSVEIISQAPTSQVLNVIDGDDAQVGQVLTGLMFLPILFVFILLAACLATMWPPTVSKREARHKGTKHRIESMPLIDSQDDLGSE